MPLYHLPCRNSGDRWKHSLFPEDYLSAERKLAGNSYAIYLLWVSCILFHFIAFFCLSLYTLEQNLQVINYLQPITILKYSIFFCQEALLLPSQIHLPISATFWNEKCLWILGCISYISIKLNEPLFQTWCKQCTLLYTFCWSIQLLRENTEAFSVMSSCLLVH